MSRQSTAIRFDSFASEAERAESIALLGESIARQVDSDAIKSIPSTGEHKIYKLTKYDFADGGDIGVDWESNAAP